MLKRTAIPGLKRSILAKPASSTLFTTAYVDFNLEARVRATNLSEGSRAVLQGGP